MVNFTCTRSDLILEDVEELRKKDLHYVTERAEILFVYHTHINELKKNPAWIENKGTIKIFCTNTSAPCDLSPLVQTTDIDPEVIWSLTSTPEHAVGLMMAGHRAIVNPCTSNLSFIRDDYLVDKPLSKSSVGIFGYGRVGQYIAKICRGMGMSVFPYETRNPLYSSHFGTNEAYLKARKCDFVFNALTSHGNKDFFDKYFFWDMSENAGFIDVSQPGITRFEHLIECLEECYIRFAALDIIEQIPEYLYNRVNDLLNDGRLFLTPHIGGSTKHGRRITEKHAILTAAKRLYPNEL
jgi:lactate dehydrogenase-like 2-hydroxyacid dehydrogenase